MESTTKGRASPINAWYWVKFYRGSRKLATCPASLYYADSMRRQYVRKAWNDRKAQRNNDEAPLSCRGDALQIGSYAFGYQS